MKFVLFQVDFLSDWWLHYITDNKRFNIRRIMIEKQAKDVDTLVKEWTTGWFAGLQTENDSFAKMITYERNTLRCLLLHCSGIF